VVVSPYAHPTATTDCLFLSCLSGMVVLLFLGMMSIPVVVERRERERDRDGVVEWSHKQIRHEWSHERSLRTPMVFS
jgi:inner membrane protein involved in colicin E2 resistance